MKIKSLVYFLLLSFIQLYGAALVPLDQIDIGSFRRSVDWLQSGGTKYLAAGGGGGAVDDVGVFSFDGSTLTATTATIDLGLGFASEVAWLQSGGIDFLAIAATVSPAPGGRVRIYTFNGSSLTQIDSVNFGNDALGVAWLQAENGSIFLAAAGLVNGTNEVSVYSFDGTSLTFLDGEDYFDGAQGVAWLQAANGTIYLASAGNSIGTDIRVFSFNGTTLTPITSASLGQGESVSWLQTADGSIFLAAGASAISPNLIVYSFNGTALTPIDSDTFGSVVNDVKWLQSGGINYLATAGDATSEYRVYTFSSPTLTLAASGTLTGDEGNGVAWLEMNNMIFLGAAGSLTNFVGKLGVFRLCPNPIANSETALTGPDTPVVINVIANDQLECDATLQSPLITPPANGIAVIDTISGTITYTPNPGFIGVDTLVYEICDTTIPAQCSQATVSIIVSVTPTDLLSKAIQDKYFPFCSLIN